MTLIVLLVITFLLSYFSKRRFGLVVLGLVAGSVLSRAATTQATEFLQANNIVISSPPMGLVVSIGLLILPAAIFLMIGPHYHDLYKKILGSLVIAIVATVLIVAALQQDAPRLLEADVYVAQVMKYQSAIIIGAILSAVFDVTHAHIAKSKSKK